MGQFKTSARRRQAWPSTWRDYLRFIRDPALPAATRPFGAEAVRQVGALLALDLILVSLFLLLLNGLVSTGWHPPHNKLEIGVPWIRMFSILIAPPLEEMMFRAWLPGRRVTLVVAGSLFALFAVFSSTLVLRLGTTGHGLLFVAWGIATAIGLHWSWNRNSVPAGYRAVFPAAFWLSCAVFAVLHVFNYRQPTLFVLPMVVPQFISGTILGFARLRFGMWANISIHSLSNAAIVAFALLLA